MLKRKTKPKETEQRVSRAFRLRLELDEKLRAESEETLRTQAKIVEIALTRFFDLPETERRRVW